MAASLLEISEEQRRTVRAMAGFGMPLRDIAAYLETDEVTLRRAMGPELARAALEANAKVAQALFTMATQQSNVAAAIFWLKARALWRDRPDSQADQAAAQPPRYVIRADPMTEEEWLTAYGHKSGPGSAPRTVIRAPAECATVEEWMDRYAPEHIRRAAAINPAPGEDAACGGARDDRPMTEEEWIAAYGATTKPTPA